MYRELFVFIMLLDTILKSKAVALLFKNHSKRRVLTIILLVKVAYIELINK